MTVTLTKYKKYLATIKLKGFVKSLAPNHMIVEKLQEAGFTNVFVDGSGEDRRATGVWSGETRRVETLPDEIIEVKEL